MNWFKFSEFILLLVGIFGLWGGTEVTLKYASALATRLRVSTFFIGLTILAFGTDLPELVVAIDGAIYNLKGIDSSGIILGNAVGSSVAQISIVLGITALIRYVSIGKVQTYYVAVELLGSVVLLGLVSIDGEISLIDGLILLVAFLIYFSLLVKNERKRRNEVDTKVIKSNVFLQVLGIIVGLAIVILSADLTVSQALIIAESWGLTQSFVGAILIGLGTSLPELAISINAIRKDESGLSVGNIIGSNIFDILVPIGGAAVISTIYVEQAMVYFDMTFLLFISAVVIWLLGRKRGLQRHEGVTLTVLYIIYVGVKYYL